MRREASQDLGYFADEEILWPVLMSKPGDWHHVRCGLDDETTVISNIIWGSEHAILYFT